MSLRRLLRMKCNVFRKSETKDEYNNIVTTWPDEPTHSKVPCYIEDMTVRKNSDTYKSTTTGVQWENMFFGVYSLSADVLPGDRVECPFVTPSVLYVSKIITIYNPRTGKQSHQEAALGIEEI